MKSSLSKLRRFALHKSDTKDKIDFLPSSSQVDDLDQAAQDMQVMRNCYDSLLSAAAATANSAYEFSESLQEMGSCLMEKTSLHDDEESRKVLLMLGEVQFELQKLVDNYVSAHRHVVDCSIAFHILLQKCVHPDIALLLFILQRSNIFLTITNPSESLLNELRTVEVCSRQFYMFSLYLRSFYIIPICRNVCEYVMAQQREKGKSKSGKGESVSLQQQLQAANDEYEEEARLCVFRLKSLKQGQYRSLLTQAARHHAAQLNFFRKGFKSLEAVDTHVRLVAERQHIDYQFSGLEDNDGEDGEDSYYANEAGELSFDYRDNKQGLDVVSTSRKSMEVDDVDVSFPQASTVENAEVNLDKNPGEYQASHRERRGSSFSAPIFPERKIDPAERIRQVQQSSARQPSTYVLPTPIDAKVPISSSVAPRTRPSNPSGRTYNLSHSSPLEQKKEDRDYGDAHLSEHSVLKSQSLLKESDSNNASTRPPPLRDGLALPQLDTLNSSDTKKIKTQASSGPLSSKSSSSKPALSSSGPITYTELPQIVSGLLSHAPVPQTKTSPRVSPTASPPLVSSPRISELHELPRPPNAFATKPAKSSGLVGHSAPLMFRNQEHTSTNKNPSMASNTASPLPIPPLIVSRSFSIPSSSQKAMALHVSKFLESPKVVEKLEGVSSPPLTPISLANVKPVSIVSEVSSQSAQNQRGLPLSSAKAEDSSYKAAHDEGTEKKTLRVQKNVYRGIRLGHGENGQLRLETVTRASAFGLAFSTSPKKPKSLC
ncbi:hypothetical protein KPL70_003265 [Citrus sinensis]|nr:hypothetical protein KPL70_003265 [Citrus sinensis]